MKGEADLSLRVYSPTLFQLQRPFEHINKVFRPAILCILRHVFNVWNCRSIGQSSSNSMDWLSMSGYVEARIRLLKIEVREDMAAAITHGLQFAFLLLVAFLFIIFLSIALCPVFWIDTSGIVCWFWHCCADLSCSCFYWLMDSENKYS